MQALIIIVPVPKNTFDQGSSFYWKILFYLHSSSCRVGSLTPLRDGEIFNLSNTIPTSGNLPIIADRIRALKPNSPTKLNQSSGSKTLHDHHNSSFDSKSYPISTQPTPLSGAFQKQAALEARQRENHYVTTTMFARNAIYRQDTRGTEFSVSNEKSNDLYVTFRENGSRPSLAETEEKKAFIRSKHRASSERPMKALETQENTS